MQGDIYTGEIPQSDIWFGNKENYFLEGRDLKKMFWTFRMLSLKLALKARILRNGWGKRSIEKERIAWAGKQEKAQTIFRQMEK